MKPCLTIKDLVPPHLVNAPEKDTNKLHLELNRGEILVIFGPENSGKADLLACLAGLEPVAKGQVLHGSGLKTSKWDSRLAIVPRVPGVYEELRVREYLAFFADACQVDEHYRPPLLNQSIAICQLQNLEQKKVATLSFAERKRLSLARAILPDPDLVFLDDPFFRLERSERASLTGVLGKLQERGMSIVATGPGLGDFSEIATYLCVLTTQEVLAYGPVAKLRASLSCFKMMQVQFESGFRKAVRLLGEEDCIHHLSVSQKTANLVRFLFKGSDTELTDLLRKMAQHGSTIVSYVEDQQFLGRGGRPVSR